jgi:hypothetical protein
MQDNERWKELCEQASKEQDPKKLHELIRDKRSTGSQRSAFKGHSAQIVGYLGRSGDRSTIDPRLNTRRSLCEIVLDILRKRSRILSISSSSI